MRRLLRLKGAGLGIWSREKGRAVGIMVVGVSRLHLPAGCDLARYFHVDALADVFACRDFTVKGVGAACAIGTSDKDSLVALLGVVVGDRRVQLASAEGPLHASFVGDTPQRRQGIPIGIEHGRLRLVNVGVAGVQRHGLGRVVADGCKRGRHPACVGGSREIPETIGLR